MKNICITGLLNNYTVDITKKLSDSMEMFFADIIKMVEFDIIDIGSTINILGLDYYKKLLYKKLREVSTFENTITYINYYIMNYDECKDILKDYITVYLEVDEKFYDKNLIDENKTELEVKLEKKVFKLRNTHFSKQCDIVIKCLNKTDEQIVAEIKNKILGFCAKEYL